MPRRKYPLALMLIFCLISLHGSAQYRYMYANPFAFVSQASRYTIGANVVSVTANYSGLVPLFNASGNMVGDTIIDRTLKSTSGVGYALGVTLPIARTARRRSISLSIDFQMNSFIFDDVNEGYGPDGFLRKGGFTYLPIITTTQQYALPLSVDFKFGSDAIAVRTTRVGCDFGVGVIPRYQSTTFGSFTTMGGLIDNKTTTTFSPFVKAEFSLYWYTCVRIKAFYSFDNAKLFENTSVSSTTHGAITSSLTTRSTFVLSTTILPFSFLWEKERNSHGWWDDYETERPWMLRD